MVKRDEFESWDSKKQRKYAERMYSIVRKELLSELRDMGIFRDATGSLLTETHHCWERSHCPLWWIFQKENMLPISSAAHYAIHNFSKDQYTEDVKRIADQAEKRRNLVIQLDK